MVYFCLFSNCNYETNSYEELIQHFGGIHFMNNQQLQINLPGFQFFQQIIQQTVAMQQRHDFNPRIVNQQFTFNAPAAVCGIFKNNRYTDRHNNTVKNLPGSININGRVRVGNFAGLPTRKELKCISANGSKDSAKKVDKISYSLQEKNTKHAKQQQSKIIKVII